MRYAIVIERGEDYFSAHVPDLIGCAASGATLEEAKDLVKKEIEARLASMREDGLAIDEPTTQVDYIEV